MSKRPSVNRSHRVAATVVAAAATASLGVGVVFAQQSAVSTASTTSTSGTSSSSGTSSTKQSTSTGVKVTSGSGTSSATSSGS